MNPAEVNQLVADQRTYFHSGATLPVAARIAALMKLKTCIKQNEKMIAEALRQDLGKSEHESYMCEVGLCQSELTYMIRHVRKLARSKTAPTPLAQFHSHSFTVPVPRGVVLIMSPWNYPFLLTIEPLIDAIAAGNTVVVKPSAYSPKTTEVMRRLLTYCFPKEQVAVVTGGRSENTALLEADFDYIFFTGSQAVGREVMRKAAEHLTPVTLELGGKSPCIVERSANIALAAKRIVFGKYLNVGQTCVAPDYILCDRRVKEQLIAALKKEICSQYGVNALLNPDYGKIINEKHFRRISGLIDPDKVVFGGRRKEETLQIEPTIMDRVTWEDPVMQEEIFGPVLPVLTYDDMDEVIRILQEKQHPLALYIFTADKKLADHVIARVGFGGGCINDTIIHIATSAMPFGGMKESGMGSYHGKVGFETFSHRKSIVDKKTWIDMPMRYQPYKKIYDTMIHFFMK